MTVIAVTVIHLIRENFSYAKDVAEGITSQSKDFQKVCQLFVCDTKIYNLKSYMQVFIEKYFLCILLKYNELDTLT